MSSTNLRQFTRNKIDHYNGPIINDFSDLRKYYGTGQAYTIPSNPRNKHGYRHGIQCNIGDIELSEWQRLVKDLIARKQEQHIFNKLLIWVKQYGFARDSNEAIQHALEHHASRIFEDRSWSGYEEFINLK